MACDKDISNVCAENTFSTCVDYEGNLGENTKITDSCVTQHDVNEDLYAITDETITAIDVSAIVGDCITIPPNSTIADIVVLLKEKICEQESRINTLENIDYSQLDITTWGLTIPTCIADSCANPPTVLADWMQVMMDQRNCT